MKQILPLSFFLLLMTTSVFGQTDEQKQMMLRISKDKGIESLARKIEIEHTAERKIIEEYARKQNIPLRQIRPDGAILYLKGFRGESKTPIYLIADNVISAQSTNTNLVHTGGGLGLTLDGNGFRVAEWDGGSVLATHELYNGRVTNYDAVATSSHATHVCGTMIGDDSGDITAKGMAPMALLDAWDFNDDETEMSSAASGGEGMGPYLVSNHSYGSIAGWRYSDPDWYWYGEPAYSEIEDPSFGWYNASAVQWDEIAYAAPYYLIFKSAGNDRGDTHTGTHFVWDGGWVASTTARAADGTGAINGDGYDCISTSGTAKNIMTIGAVNDIAGGYNAPGDVSMSSFSGWGPTDDGRIKPDIVANGVGLTSSTNASDTSYGSSSGTSMSSPSAAGSAILLQEHFSETHGTDLMRAATLKALIIHSANEAGAAIGPDYIHGWGLMNTAGAANVITEDVTNADIITENTISNGSTFTTTICGAGDPIIATIVWTDPAGTVTPYNGSVLDNPSLKLVNDLDMRISDGTTTYMPYILDPANPSAAATTGDNFRDNVEKIYIPAGAGSYTLTITHKGTLASDQVFSLITTGISVPKTNDTGIASISGIASDICADNAPPVKLNLRNYACLANLTSCTVHYQLNGGTVETFDWLGDLGPGLEEEITLLLPLTAGTGQTLDTWTTLPNGVADEDASNDLSNLVFDYNNFGGSSQALPYSQDFSGGFPGDMSIDNPDASTTWVAYNHAACPAFGNSARLDNYNYNASGQLDGLVTPMLDLSNVSLPELTFDIAYAPWSGGNSEGFEIRISTDCGSSASTVWSRSGLGLSTNGGGGLGTGSNVGDPAWFPACTDWATDVTLDLSAYEGQHIQISFVNVNGWGQNLFIDNINVTGTNCPTPTLSVTPNGTDYCGSQTLVASGAPVGYTYQWFKDNNSIPNATSATYTADENGVYNVALVGDCNFTKSSDVTISQTAPLALSSRGTTGTCTFRAVDNWIYILDNADNVIARIDDNGNDLGNVTATTFDHGATIPRFGGIEYMQRSFEISVDNQPSSNVDVELFFSNTELNNLIAASPDVSDILDIAVTKETGGTLGQPYTGATDLIIPTSTNMSAGPGSSHSVVLSVNGFSTFFLHGGTMPFPVELLNFEGELRSKEVVLDWTTASELNNHGFEVERLSNNNIFEKIGFVRGQGNSAAENHYTFIDNNLEGEILYYRLKQIDVDGTYDYSKIVEVKIPNEKDVHIYPNPFRNMISFELSESLVDKEINILIYNLQGKLMKNQAFRSTDKNLVWNINDLNLTNQVYIITVESEGVLITQKKIVKH